MNCEERYAKISELRKKDIIGKFIILRPATVDYAEDIVKLRNRPKNLYWFNQLKEITIENQKEWFSNYLLSIDDIYWCILDKKENFIGTIRLYKISDDGSSCEEGSYVIDEDVSDEAPYAIEAKFIILDVAFNELQMKKVLNNNRFDNKIMNNMDNQLGFDKGNVVKIQDVDYIHRVLLPEKYQKNRLKFLDVINYWSER